jgi:hypothetical protein
VFLVDLDGGPFAARFVVGADVAPFPEVRPGVKLVGLVGPHPAGVGLEVGVPGRALGLVPDEDLVETVGFGVDPDPFGRDGSGVCLPAVVRVVRPPPGGTLGQRSADVVGGAVEHHVDTERPPPVVAGAGRIGPQPGSVIGRFDETRLLGRVGGDAPQRPLREDDRAAETRKEDDCGGNPGRVAAGVVGIGHRMPPAGERGNSCGRRVRAESAERGE